MPLILGTNSIKDTGYDVANSLRFNGGSTDYLYGAGGAGSTKTKFTFSAWVKKSEFSATGGDDLLIGKRDSSNDRGHINFSSDAIKLLEKVSGSTTVNLITNRLFRDHSAWYHILYIGDTTQGTEANRLKLYVNGTQETSFSTATYPSENYNWQLQALTLDFGVGAFTANAAGGAPLSGYLSEVVYLDGVAGDVGDFGEFDSDSPTIWKPKDVSSLTFGTNGFYLEFKQSGTGTNSSGMGADTSGNNNHLAVNNLTAIDQSTDTCTNNFCTMNPLTSTQDFNLSEGNLKLGASADNEVINGTLAGTIDNTNSGYYFEYKVNASNLGNNGEGFRMGIVNVDDIMLSPFTSARVLNVTNPALVYQTATNGGADRTDTDIGSASNGDIVMVAWKNGKVWLGVNGTFVNSGNPSAGSGEQFSGLSGEFIPFVMCSLTNGVNGSQFNFGNPTFSISSGNADANGFGNFEYAPPTGFFALCTKNIAEIG